TSYNDSWCRTHFCADLYGFRLSHRGKCGLDFRGGCDSSGAFCQRQIAARRAADERDGGDDDLRRAACGNDAAAIDGDAFPIVADRHILDQRFTVIPARRDATINSSYTTPECDAAEFLLKQRSAIPSGEACSWETRVRF